MTKIKSKHSYAGRSESRRYPPSHPRYKQRLWDPFVLIRPVVAHTMEEQVVRDMAQELDLSKEAPHWLARHRSDERWVNNLYSVTVKYLDPIRKKAGPVHLQVVRRDQAPVHDWRDMQRIKNEIAGPEREAVELYPAVSRLLDTANNFHLWVAEEGTPWDLGWAQGETIVMTAAVASRLGAKQRDYAWDDPMRPISLAGDKAFLEWAEEVAGRA